MSNDLKLLQYSQRDQWRGIGAHEAALGAWDAINRYRAGEVDEQTLMRGKDTGRTRADTLSFWLWRQHHAGSAPSKTLGQRFWSTGAVASFIKHAPTLPAGRKFGEDWLINEHVVPKRVCKQRLFAAKTFDAVLEVFELNLAAVVTRAEDRRLRISDNPDPTTPWRRYMDAEIAIIDTKTGERVPLS